MNGDLIEQYMNKYIPCNQTAKMKISKNAAYVYMISTIEGEISE